MPTEDAEKPLEQALETHVIDASTGSEGECLGAQPRDSSQIVMESAYGFELVVVHQSIYLVKLLKNNQKINANYSSC